jgi:hypothetical protein
MNKPFSWTALARSAARGETRKITFGKGPAFVLDAMGSGGFAYLASPYSKRVLNRHGKWDLGLSAKAAHEAAAEVARLKAVGVAAFSPIALSAAVVHATLNPYCQDATPDACHDPLYAAAWLEWCMPFLIASRALVIPEIAGWDQSDGIRAEAIEALDLGIPVIVYADGGWSGQ